MGFVFGNCSIVVSARCVSVPPPRVLLLLVVWELDKF